jgi:hypothetical protein
MKHERIFSMATMVEHSDVQIKHAPRKFRDARHPALKNAVAVPMARASDTHSVATRVLQSSSSTVEMARMSADSDANATLMKLRELVVGPAQQLNEARLEELMKIFEEREAELRAVMRDVQKRNSELEVELKQHSLEQLNACKAEFRASTEAMSAESKKTFATIRDEIAGARKEALTLIEDAKAVAEQKLEAQRVRLTSLLEAETSKLRLDQEAAAEKAENSLRLSQREAQLNISRILKDASDNLASAS